MSFFDIFRLSGQKRSADHAKDRLKLLLAHERSHRNGPDFLPMLQKELVAVICKYIEIDTDRVEVKLESNGDISMLEVNIELPQGKRAILSEPCAPAS
jgi:cell division topological specificity factor